MSALQTAKTQDIDAIRRNPNDILGIQFNQYKNAVYSSITDPATYFKKRNEMEIKLKEVLVTNMFDAIYDLLRYGVIVDKTGVEHKVCINDAQPNYPSNLVNDEAQKITSTFNEIIDDIITILMPADYEDVAKDKLRIKARAVGL